MRTKSHIGLARFLYQYADYKQQLLHRYFLYAGSILPDCRLSFITTKHNIENTLPLIQSYMEQVRLHQRQTAEYVFNRRDSVTLGQILHYIADYFTWPHNRLYPGNLADHCCYEEYLKLRLREYFRSGLAFEVPFTPLGCHVSPQEIIHFIQEKHQEYLALPEHSIEKDCEYIIAVNQSVIHALTA